MGAATVHSRALGGTAYRLEEVTRAFPPHFHDYYVIGLVERGERSLRAGKARELREGQLLLLNPGDNHSCRQRGESRRPGVFRNGRK